MRPDLIWRAALPVGAMVASIAGAPAPVSGGLALLGLAVALDRLVRLRGLGVTDRVLVGVGGLLVTLVLLGTALGSSGVALRPSTWVAALAAASLLGLALADLLPGRPLHPRAAPRRRTRTRRARRTALLALPWAAAAVLVVVLSVHASTTSLAEADAKPLEMSFGTVTGTSVEVVVSDSAAIGPIEIHTSGEGIRSSYPYFTLEPGGTQTTTLSLPATGRYVITLRYHEQLQPLRTLVLDR